MNNDLNEEIWKVRKLTQCPKDNQCINAVAKNLLLAKQNAKYDLTRCIDVAQSKACHFPTSLEATPLCKCPLRKLITLHFDEVGSC